MQGFIYKVMGGENFHPYIYDSAQSNNFTIILIIIIIIIKINISSITIIDNTLNK